MTYMLKFVRRPYPDELLSSWLERVAAVYGTTWSDLRTTNGYPNVADHGNEPAVIDFLAQLTQLPRQTIEALDLAKRFPGQPLRRFACHPATRRAVVEICPGCLFEDVQEKRDNYLRYQWAIGGLGHCHKHRVLLRTACPACHRELSIGFANAGEGLQAHCVVCKQGLPFQSYREHQRQTPLSHFTVMAERRVLATVNGAAWCAPWLQAVEDIAFLLFCMELPQNGVAVKEGLGRWGREIAALITPVLESKGLIGDRSLLFPLATTRSVVKARLLAVATVIAKKRAYDSELLPLRGEMEPTLASLFFHLDEAGREELIHRADRWPAWLRSKVRGIHRRARKSSGRSRNKAREPQASSRARRDANGGSIPLHEHV